MKSESPCRSKSQGEFSATYRAAPVMLRRRACSRVPATVVTCPAARSARRMAWFHVSRRRGPWRRSEAVRVPEAGRRDRAIVKTRGALADDHLRVTRSAPRDRDGRPYPAVADKTSAIDHAVFQSSFSAATHLSHVTIRFHPALAGSTIPRSPFGRASDGRPSELAFRRRMSTVAAEQRRWTSSRQVELRLGQPSPLPQVQASGGKQCWPQISPINSNVCCHF